MTLKFSQTKTRDIANITQYMMQMSDGQLHLLQRAAVVIYSDYDAGMKISDVIDAELQLKPELLT